jgi:hypothetical protein
MKKTILGMLIILSVFFISEKAIAQHKDLKLIFIRHAEKPNKGDNLNCQGFNRSMLLPSLLFKKFGKPMNVYIPSLKLGAVTKHMRMLQTISPFAVKYDLSLNSEFDVGDSKGIGKSLLAERGTVLIVWEHQRIIPILQLLGVNTEGLTWRDDDFDTIWVVTFSNGRALMTPDREMLSPPPGCAF